MENELLKKFNRIKNMKLVAAVIIDLVGLTTYVVPGAAEGGDMVWGPISGFLIYMLFPNRRRMALMGAVEEMLPFTDFVPTAYLAWRLDYVKDKNKTLTEFLNQRMDEYQVVDVILNDNDKESH
ncbi:MAG TPA: hypothetical protein VLS94_09190 [Fusibacter sp.]|nr:hypothetical protein [Fusibacter sp.]